MAKTKTGGTPEEPENRKPNTPSYMLELCLCGDRGCPDLEKHRRELSTNTRRIWKR